MSNHTLIESITIHNTRINAYHTEPGFLIRLEGGMELLEKGRDLYLQVEKQAIRAVQENQDSLEIDISCVQSINQEGVKVIDAFIKRIMDDPYLSTHPFSISYHEKSVWQKRALDQCIQGFDLSNKPTVKKSTHPPFWETDSIPRVVLVGLDDAVQDELAYQYLQEGADVKIIQSQPELEHAILLHRLTAVIINPLGLQGWTSQTLFRWTHKLPLIKPPKMFITTNDEPAFTLANHIQRIPVVNIKTCTSLLENEGVKLIHAHRIEQKERRKAVRVQATKKFPLHLDISIPDKKIEVHSHVLNLSMGGFLIELARPIMDKVLQLNTLYEKAHLIGKRINIHITIMLVMKNKHFFGVKISHIKEEDKQHLAAYILKLMNEP